MTSEDLGNERERRAFVLRSLTRVGPEKPVGYLPLNTLVNFAEVEPARVSAEAIARGIAAVQFGPDECCIQSGALYLYDPQALGRLLQAHADTLAATGMPTEPEPFIAQIAAVWIEADHPAYRIIAKAFGESL
jgi:hypothetical protein